MARRRLTPAQPGYAPSTGTSAPMMSRAAPIAQVSGQSAEAASLRDMAHSIQAARDEGRMVLDIPLTEVSPGHLIRDRVGLDREELEVLKASIRRHGQRVPADVAPLVCVESNDTDGAAYRFGLISGWRRLAALRELYDETGEPRFATLKALIRPEQEAAASYVAMIEENEIRVGLSYYERARVVAELPKRGVFPDQATALRTLFAAASRAKRSKIGSFVEIYDALGDVLRFPEDIPERLGLALVALLRESGAGPAREALAQAGPATSAEELAVLERLCRAAKSAPVSRAKQAGEALRPGVTMTLRGRGTARQLVLSGPGVDDAMIARLREALKDV